jgi:hypothetical protein
MSDRRGTSLGSEGQTAAQGLTLLPAGCIPASARSRPNWGGE